MLSLQKKPNYFLSLHSPIFLSKIHKRRGTFFETVRGNSLKRTYVEGGVCKLNRDEHGGGGGQNLEVLS